MNLDLGFYEPVKKEQKREMKDIVDFNYLDQIDVPNSIIEYLLNDRP